MRSLLLVCALASGAVASPPSIVVAVPVLEVLDPTGAITPAAAREAIARVEPALVRCAADTKWKGDALAWIISDWHGKVTKVELAVDRPAVEKCFAQALRAIVIANAHARATMMLRFRIGLPPKDAGSGSAAPPKPAPSTTPGVPPPAKPT